MTERPDPYDLERFVAAQQGVYETAIAELRAGRKRSDWMWFIFPQMRGLGASPTAQHYAISGLDEARAYLQHPILGARLVECAEVLIALQTDDATGVLGYPDDVKLRSSATLFATVSSPGSVFDRVLAKFFSGQRDERTVAILRSPEDFL